MPKTGRLTGPTKADGTQQPEVEQRARDLEFTGPRSDLTVGGTLSVAGVDMTPVDLADLPAATTPLDGAETLGGEQDGVAVSFTSEMLAGAMTEARVGQTRNRLRWFDHLEGFTGSVTSNAAIIGESKFRTILSGTGSGVTQAQTIAECGIADTSTGTTTTGRCGIEPCLGTLYLFDPSDTFRMGARFKMPVVSDGTDTYRVICGFGDLTTVTPADGFFFRSPTAAGNWQAVIRDDSADAFTADTGVAVDSNGSYHVFVVEYVPATGWRWYIDGVAVASTATIVLDTLANMQGVGASIVKSAGTTARALKLDALSYNVPQGFNVHNMP